MNDKIQVIGADWIVPVVRPPLKQGAVAIGGNGRIIEVGIFEDLRTRYKTLNSKVRFMNEHLLMPSMVNAHIHFYYCPLKGKLSSWMGFTGWLESLLNAKQLADRDFIREGIKKEAGEMYRKGVSIVGNICSENLWDADLVAGSSLKGINFIEVIGFQPFKAAEIIKNLPKRNELAENHTLGFKSIPVPHSLYSCSPQLIAELVKISEEHKIPYTMHLAESRDESEFIMNGGGDLLDFLKERGAFYNSWVPTGMSPVKYLDSIGCLKEGMLAVHLVQVDSDDIRLLSERGVIAVVCPGSNRYLGVGTAPLDVFLEKGLTVCIGTDSAAGNERQDMFYEMRVIREEHPSIPPAKIIEMATLNGARAMGFADNYGSIEKGKTADLIALPMPASLKEWTGGEVEEYITSSCNGEKVSRLDIKT